MGSRLEQKSNLVRKRIEGHEFDNEEGDEYEGSKFGGFPEYFRRKKIKLQNLDAELRASSTDKPQIFKGVVCHVNGYTQPSLNDLHIMIVQHGGGFIQYLDGKTMVTHIIASNLTPKKKEEFRRYRIVKPAWVVDSIAAGKLLPWDAYRVVDEGVGQKVLGFDNGQVVSQANVKTQGYREQTETSWYTSQLKSKQSGQASGSEVQPPPAQTITPQNDVDDDEFPLPDITSSMEEALHEASKAGFDNNTNVTTSNKPTELLEVRTTIETPPPTSPPELREPPDVTAEESDPRKAASEVDAGDGLAPREGSQEPDYSMAVIRQSEIMRTVSPSRLASMTAEEHNALLLSDPNIRKSTVVNPGFLEQYYRESRLHHLSTWKADLKSQLQALAAEKTFSQKARMKRLPGQRRYIMHVDFDSFFAAVSLKKYPQYVDKPAVVAHGGGSGSEIASCNYPARKFGITNGMWMKRAQGLCPDVKILPYDFPGYEEASRQFYDAIIATGGLVQSVSIDEALVDISPLCIAEGGQDGVKRNEGAVHREQTKADELAQRLRDEVLEKTGCAVSVGIGGNILLAKVALRKAKPAGQYQLKPEEVLDFIGELEVQRLPGVAWSIGGKLEEIGVKLVKDIRETSREKLLSTLGPKTGEKMWEYARGIDKTEVGDQVVRKSVSAEVNWGVRFENQEQVDEFMHGLCGELNKRLVKEGVKGKQLTMKVMRRAADAPRNPPKHLGHGKCDTFNKSLQLGVATNDTALITKEAIAMMRSFAITPGELRGIGVQMQKLEPIKQGVDGKDHASQARLQFKVGQPIESLRDAEERKVSDDPIQDDIRTPSKPRIAAMHQPSVPVKPIEADASSHRPLNTLGTQFILPSQVDPEVLAELPADIRAKLSRNVPKTQDAVLQARIDPIEAAATSSSANSSRAQSPTNALPPQSQLDPSILDALPEDVRNEVLGFYRSPRKRGEQLLLPQSPRKLRTLAPGRPGAKRGRPRGSGGLFSRRGRGQLQGGGSSSGDRQTLTQANFVTHPFSRHKAEEQQQQQQQHDQLSTEPETEPEEQLDAEFLAALPDDLRREVLDQQRQTRLLRTGGIDLSMHQRPTAARRKKKAMEENALLDRVFALPPRPPLPTFTAKKLSRLEDLRAAVKAWYQEFSDDAPYDEDVAALVKYLREVVLDERDLEKAVAVVRWMGWVVDQGEETVPEDVQGSWREALGTTQRGVQEAILERGLGKVDFD